MAQDTQAPARLEDLIPDSAVENPEEWAADGVSTEAQADDLAEPVLEPDSPMAELPAMEVPWPDQQLDLPELVRLPRDEAIDFAELESIQDEDADDEVAALADAQLEVVSDQLTLAFPVELETFPVREEFVSRFKSLSTIQSLSDEEGSIAQLAARARADEDLLEQLLEIYGYYDAQIIRSVSGRTGLRDQTAAADRPAQDARQPEPSVRFDIIPGPRFRFGAINLGQLGEAPDATALRQEFGINTGDPLSSDAIVEEQIDLDIALGETGYSFAEIKEPELLVDHARTEGDLTMIVLPKGKYVFGNVISDMPDFLSSKHLETIARFDEGDIYQRSLALDLRRAITATGLVSTVSVTPREVTPPTGDQPGIVAMDVAMTKAPLRTIAGAIGYGTEEGFRIAASWEHRNLFPSEGALRVRGIIGTREQLAGVTFRKNNFGGRDRVLTLDAYASTIDTNAFDANTAALAGTYERVSNLLFQKPFSWGVGFELLATDERPAAVDGMQEERQTYLIAALPVRGLIDSTDDLLDPTKGFRAGARLSPEISRSQGTESFYLRSQVDASYYKQINDKVVLATRARFGSIPGTSLENIAPSRRFYAGGGSSVRGYGYQAIGPQDALGEPSGGRSLVELSFEARIRTGFFDGALAVVPFVDAGSVGTGATPDFDDIRIGAGVGVRYYTGFGPIRVDVATPINPGPGDGPIAVYVSLGQAF
ncbi:autotransporter assembly complex protein TamA [Allopontixanthobacter sp.]|uniref:autotransporter assembly complex protein TamA n=1 Tax=Allopontixanthobacter sp. TaxID=2906452 RepID=UPI002ABCD57C|nr:BamA/TamA family outer membrane protein [Allopontixanthobacter sp.]MDZ4306431.1 BamA/TamA family outer membrane protein [Allopontixanthobacter sp.]